MAKFLFIGSTEEMAKFALNYIKAEGRSDVEIVSIPAREIKRALEHVKMTKAKIIIARGIVAAEIKRTTTLSVVEIVVTAQEMGILIKKAKTLIGKEMPVIGIVGIDRMFCDMQKFDKIFDIKLVSEFVTTLDALKEAVERVVAAGAELIIGGELVCKYAAEHGIPSLHQPHGRDSIEQAFRVADSVAWAAEMEKKNAAELNVLLDYSSNGIIKINNEGFIVSLNNRVLSLLEKTRDEIEGKSIKELVPQVNEKKIFEDVLVKGQEVFFTFWHSSGSALAVNAVPLMVDNAVEGAIFSLHKISKLKQLEEEARRDLNQHDRSGDFKWIAAMFSENQSFLQSSKKYAQYEEAIMLTGSHSVEREIIARYMHDESLHRGENFINTTAKIFDVESLERHLLSTGSGTLFIDKIENLSGQGQDILFGFLSNKLIPRHNMGSHDIRIITGSEGSLTKAVQEGTFREDLYYIISAVTLEVPLLKNCHNEIKNWLNHYLQQYSEMYSSYIHITRAARNIILSHPWNGGLAELRGFCCKVAMSTPKNILDEPTALRFIRSNNPYESKETAFKDPGITANQEVARLKFLIDKYNGNRALIADEMHISTTTLWRRLKKYGLS